jgi:hypothetical protein
MTVPLNTASLVSELRWQAPRLEKALRVEPPLTLDESNLMRRAADALESTSRALSEKEGELAEARGEARNADGDLYRDLWKASSKNVARVCGVASRQRDLIDACAPYLKDGETPRERMDRDFKDSQALTELLAEARGQRDEALAALTSAPAPEDR